MINSKIREFFETDSDFKSRLPAGLKDTDSLIDSGIIDSLAVVKLIVFIEETFKVSVESEELAQRNFETIEAIENLISCKIKGNKA